MRITNEVVFVSGETTLCKNWRGNGRTRDAANFTRGVLTLLEAGAVLPYPA